MYHILKVLNIKKNGSVEYRKDREAKGKTSKDKDHIITVTLTGLTAHLTSFLISLSAFL